MEGGKLLGTGSSSCVFSPNLPCNGGKISKDRVSKLLFHHDAKNLSKYEDDQSSIIKKIKGYKDWAIIYDEFCDAPKPEKVKKLDPEGFEECFEGDDFPYVNAKLLNSDNGGQWLIYLLICLKVLII